MRRVGTAGLLIVKRVVEAAHGMVLRKQGDSPGLSHLSRAAPVGTSGKAANLVSQIVSDLPFNPGDEVAVLVNSLGATPREELYILFRSVHAVLAASSISVRRAWVGEYATSLEMAGASVSVLRLDDELLRLLDAPCESPFMVRR